MEVTLAPIQQVLAQVAEQGDRLRAASTTWRQKTDGTWASQIEQQVEEDLTAFFTALYPGCQVVGEENSPEAELQPGVVNVVLDPCDGSAPYRRGLGTWGVSCALLGPDLEPLLGVLYYPALARWFVAAQVEGVLKPYQVTPAGDLREQPPAGQAASRPALAENLRDEYLWVNSDPHRVLDLTRLPCKIRSFGTTSLHLALLTDNEGDPVATALHRFKLWDVVAALVICTAHGLALADLRPRSGPPLSDLPSLLRRPRQDVDNHPLLVAYPEILALLREQIALN